MSTCVLGRFRHRLITGHKTLKIMRRQRLDIPVKTPSWWTRCAIIALAIIQIVAPTWHICSMGAMPMEHSGMVTMSGMHHDHNHSMDGSDMANMSEGMSEAPDDNSYLSNLPEVDFCLALILHQMLSNNQFNFTPDFTSQTIAVFHDVSDALAFVRVILVHQARAPPAFA